MPRQRSKSATKHPGTFGYQMAKLRQARGLTQEELAALIGVSQRVVSYYENEAHEPTGSVIVKLADAFGVSADTLLNLTDPQADLMKRDTLLARKFLEAENLPPADRKTILQVVDAMLAKHQTTAKN